MHFYSLNVNMINCGVNNYLIMPLNSFKLQNISNIQKIIINPCTLPILFCLFDSDFLEIKCSSLVFSDPSSFSRASLLLGGVCASFPSQGFILAALLFVSMESVWQAFVLKLKVLSSLASLAACFFTYLLFSILPARLPNSYLGSFCYFEQLCCSAPFPSKCGRCSGGMSYSGIPGNRMCKLLVYMMSDCSLTWLHIGTSPSTVRGFRLVLATHV